MQGKGNLKVRKYGGLTLRTPAFPICQTFQLLEETSRKGGAIPAPLLTLLGETQDHTAQFPLSPASYCTHHPGESG